MLNLVQCILWLSWPKGYDHGKGFPLWESMTDDEEVKLQGSCPFPLGCLWRFGLWPSRLENKDAQTCWLRIAHCKLTFVLCTMLWALIKCDNTVRDFCFPCCQSRIAKLPRHGHCILFGLPLAAVDRLPARVTPPSCTYQGIKTAGLYLFFGERCMDWVPTTSDTEPRQACHHLCNWDYVLQTFFIHHMSSS